MPPVPCKPRDSDSSQTRGSLCSLAARSTSPPADPAAGHVSFSSSLCLPGSGSAQGAAAEIEECQREQVILDGEGPSA